MRHQLTSRGWLLAVAACVSCCAIEVETKPTSQDSDFSQPGPCSWTSWKATFSVPADIKGLGKTLPLTITQPTCGNSSGLSPPYPVVFFYSGFQSRASWYKRLVNQIASWGYVVVQYDTGVLALPSVLSEVKAFPALLAWVSKQAATPGSKLYKVANPAAPLVSGHSRGGKIAGLVFADNPQVKAAWLIDPIDASQFAPISPDNPSAAQAIKAANRPIGVTGAGVLSSCNPTEGNYAVMYAAGAPGSWEELIPGASHSLFSDGGSVINLAQDTLCGRGKISRTQVAELTTTPLLAWYWKQLQAVGVNQGPATNPLPAFDAWVKAQEKKGLIKFNVKGAPKAEDLVTEAPMQQDVALAAAHRALIVP